MANPSEHIKCPDCASPMLLRSTTKYTTRSGQPRKFYGCSRYPQCKATHGAHPDGVPLGFPADSKTKKARMRVHAVCAEIWGDWETGNRKAMYAWLRQNAPQEHIGNMSEAECEETERLLREFQRSIV